MDSIKEYLKYYIGCGCEIHDNEGVNKFKLTAYNYNYYRDWHSEIKPILRKLSSITLQEAMHVMRLVIHPIRDYPEKDYRLSLNQFGNPEIKISNDWYEETMVIGVSTGAVWTHNTTDAAYKVPASVYHYFLKQGFWVFGQEAFEKGLIIEKK